MDKKEKLLYITSDSWWDTDINVLPDLGKKFDLEVYVLSPRSGGKFPVKSMPQNIKLHNMKLGMSRKNPMYVLVSLYYAVILIYKSWNKQTFWAIDSNHYYILPLILFGRRKNFIISYHDYVDHVDALGLDKKLKKMQLKLCHRFHLQSRIQWEYFKKDYPEKASFATNMQVKDFGLPPVVTKKYFDNDLRTFLFFGYVRKYKHPEMFLKVADRFKGKANFILAGNCRNWEMYSSLTENNHSLVCDVRFIDNEEIPNIFCQSDFLVLPYEDSTQSGPLLIAYNYEVPVIVSDLEYFRKMISNGKEGFVFKVLDQENMEKTIEKAINLSNEEYNEMKKNMHYRVSHYKKEANFAFALQYFIRNTTNTNLI